MTGAFHGAMPSTTPAAWRTAIDSVPGLSDGMISPVICVVIAAASRSIPAASMTLKPAHGAVAPVSSSISLANLSLRLSNRSAAFKSSARRWPGPVSDHVAKAADAASTVRATSARLAAAARVATAPVTGSFRSKVLPPSASDAAPSMMKLMVVALIILLLREIFASGGASQALMPPSTINVLPVVKLLKSDAR